MTLDAGHRLAHYEILGTLGAGGMGVVYRAQDTRLEREVAIKVLPESFVEDEDRLRRFEREAKVLASLNHPNIDGIHGIDQQDGTCYLVLELVPGQNLSDLLARGPLPVPEAVDICRQIAEGLEAAHEAGIVHRDLKPANVRITPEGIVKVLDFGLAKPLGMGAGAGSSTAKPDSFLMTQDGVVLGTPTYMSPEQARGRPVDRRADIWAFGCVLFECLTGTRAFPGSDVLEILAVIQQDEPDWERLPAKTPPHVEQLLRRCLEKDPRRRLRDIGEARLALESPSGSAAALATATVAPLRRTSLLPWFLCAAAVVAFLWVFFRSAPVPAKPERTVTRFTVDIPLEKRRFRDRITDVAVSPDGRSVAFGMAARDEGLYLRDLVTLELRKLVDSECGDLCFSPDGRWIAFHDQKLDLIQRVRVDGGASLPLAPITAASGLGWHPGGYLATVLQWGMGLQRLQIEDGELTPLVPFEPEDGERHHLEPFFLPGGRVLLHSVWTAGRWDEARIIAYDVESGVKKTLRVRGTSPAYVPLGDGTTGALLWAITNTLWAQRFDPERLELQGDPVQVLDGIVFTVGSGQARYDVSASGTLVYVPGDQVIDETMVAWLDQDGSVEQACPEVSSFETVSVSRDGKRAIFTRAGPVYQLVTLDLTRPYEERRVKRLTFGDDAPNACISPDGKTVAYTSNPEGEYWLFVRACEGESRPRRIYAQDVRIESWTSDSRKLAFHEQDESGNSDLWYLSLDDEGEGDLEPRRLVATRAQEFRPVISPDDRWVIYFAQGDDGKFDLHVASFPGGVHQLQLTRGGGVASPRWAPDAGEIFYRKDDRAFYSVEVQTEPDFRVGSPRKLFDVKDGEDYVNPYAVGPDGRFLVLSVGIPEEQSLRLVVVENWVVELEELLSR